MAYRFDVLCKDKSRQGNAHISLPKTKSRQGNAHISLPKTNGVICCYMLFLNPPSVHYSIETLLFSCVLPTRSVQC